MMMDNMRASVDTVVEVVSSFINFALCDHLSVHMQPFNLPHHFSLIRFTARSACHFCSLVKVDAIVVGIWASSQYGECAQGVGDAILSWELVQCLGRVEDKLLNHQFGEKFEREAMYGGSGVLAVLLHCPNGTFNFSNVIISGGDVQL